MYTVHLRGYQSPAATGSDGRQVSASVTTLSLAVSASLLCVGEASVETDSEVTGKSWGDAG